MAKRHTFDYDVLVIGSGASGSVAASILAHGGKRVGIVEKDTLGGESPNYGDVPLTSLLHAAHLYDDAKHGERFGIRSSVLGYNFPLLQRWKARAITRTGAGNNRSYYEKQGIDVLTGNAHFLSPHEVTINRRHISAEKFLIASGATWRIPEVIGLDTVPYYTPRSILEVTKPPKSLFVIGGGGSAVELAQLFAVFGSKVYIAEASSRLLPHEDDEVGATLASHFEASYGATILTESRVVSIDKDGLSYRVHYSRGGIDKSVRVDDILVATGRSPLVDFGLENAGVSYSPQGVKVNEHLQTNVKYIYAAGDVLDQSVPTHDALVQGRLAAHNILNPKNMTTLDYTATPRLIFTNPSIAAVGLTEDDCMRRDLSIKKSVVPLSIVARSNTSDFHEGFVKLIADRKGMLLGASIVAPHASEMIHELAIALKYGLSISDIADTPHAFLSWSEAIRVAARKLQ